MANIFIYYVLSNKIEKRGFSVFDVCFESKFVGSVRIRQRGSPVRIYHSDSKCELLLSINITDS